MANWHYLDTCLIAQHNQSGIGYIAGCDCLNCTVVLSVHLHHSDKHVCKMLMGYRLGHCPHYVSQRTLLASAVLAVEVGKLASTATCTSQSWYPVIVQPLSKPRQPEPRKHSNAVICTCIAMWRTCLVCAKATPGPTAQRLLYTREGEGFKGTYEGRSTNNI